MGVLSTGIMLLTGTFSAFTYKIDYLANTPHLNGWSVPEEIGTSNSKPEYYYDLTVNETTPLFENIFWTSPVQLEYTIDPKNDARSSKIIGKGNDPSPKNLVEDQYQLNKKAAQEQNGIPAAEYEAGRANYNDVNEAAIERAAEAQVEEEYKRERDASRNRRENTEEQIYEGYQNSAEPKQAIAEPAELVEDHRGESSHYGHQSYIEYDNGDSHYDTYEPKKQKEIHYHQHKHLHEHDHLQEHKHQHLDEHKDKHYHDHNQHDDHKHYHQGQHEHKEQAKHYHQKYADHKHEHYQDHKHDHKNEHWHDHKQEALHKHKAKHEHHHKEEAKHNHEKNAKHRHQHHHKHEEEDKHHHKHWSEHKHGHNHHHDEKHNHDHKSNHHQQHKAYHKVKVHYKKHRKDGW